MRFDRNGLKVGYSRNWVYAKAFFNDLWNKIIVFVATQLGRKCPASLTCKGYNAIQFGILGTTNLYCKRLNL